MSFVRVPPDGAGKRILTEQHSIGGVDYQAQVFHAADPINPAYMQHVDQHGAALVSFAEGQPILSGFGALKVASEHPLGVYECSQSFGYLGLFSQFLVGSGSVDLQSTASSVVFRVSGDAGARSRVTSNRYHYYCPGASNVYKMTLACGDSGKMGNTRRWGAFDDNDGIFFELSGTTVNVGIRSSVSGTINEIRIPQDQWNVDKLDGQGTSGFAMDITKVQVWWFDYQWLGAGRVRFGVFSKDGSRLVCHIIQNAGQHPLPYMRTGTLPVTVENINTGATGATSELRVICVGVYSEVDFNQYSYWHFADIEVTRQVSTLTPLLAIRPKATVAGKHNGSTIFPASINAYSDQPFKLELYTGRVGPTGGTWSDCVSMLQKSTDSTTYDTAFGYPVASIYVPAGVSHNHLGEYYEANSECLNMNSDGTPNYFIAVCSKLGATNATVTLSLNYKELW